ncbi:cyclin Pch1 [Sugiyamaella lignohabitans]|uniref:Cyclin Pch1 n=1 Tax=Sugiyamaella lignohabitans TaxID=796027 RepID=A0A167E5T0_9ASCO|nr:cyclin Pch1 [Sugiyamaella lignohabitans]ANB13676.1 cyclin Pch1 [Sugiyamaella lignohabitans]
MSSSISSDSNATTGSPVSSNGSSTTLVNDSSSANTTSNSTHDTKDVDALDSSKKPERTTKERVDSGKPNHKPETLVPGQNVWIFSMAQVAKSPSAKDGIPTKHEFIQRAKGVNFIIVTGTQLRLPPMTIYAAALFLHRFYLRHSLKKFHIYEVGAACLFLATKVEESNRRLKDVAIACTRVASKDMNKVVDEQSKDYWKWRDTIIYNEELALEALCFDLTLKSPYEICTELMIKHEMELVEPVRKAGQHFIHDSCKTVLGLIYSAEVIAAAAFYWAVRSTGTKIDLKPKNGEENKLLGVKKQHVYDAVNMMADFYSTLQETVLSSERKNKYTRMTPSNKRKASDSSSSTSKKNKPDEAQTVPV